MYDDIQWLPPPYEHAHNVMQNVGGQFNFQIHDVSPTATRFETQPVCASTMTFDRGCNHNVPANTPSCTSNLQSIRCNCMRCLSKHIKRGSQIGSVRRTYQPRTESISPHMGASPAGFHRQAYEPTTETISPDAVHRQQQTAITQQTYESISPTNYHSYHNTSPTGTHSGTAQPSSTWSNYNSHNNNASPTGTHNGTAQQSSTWSGTSQTYIPTIHEDLALQSLMNFARNTSLSSPPYLKDCDQSANQSTTHAQGSTPYSCMGGNDCANQRIKETFNLPYCSNEGQAIGYDTPQSTNHERNTDHHGDYCTNSMQRQTITLQSYLPVSTETRARGSSSELGFCQSVPAEFLEYDNMRSDFVADSNLHSTLAVEQSQTIRYQSLDHMLIMNARTQMGLL